MPLTSPGNDDDTGENHQPTLRKNTAEPVEQTLKQNKRAGRWFVLLVVRLAEHEGLADASAGAGELDEASVVDDAVDDRGGELVVGEDRPPFAGLDVRGGG